MGSHLRRLVSQVMRALVSLLLTLTLACGGESIAGNAQEDNETTTGLRFDVTLGNNHDRVRWKPDAVMVLKPAGVYVATVDEWIDDPCTEEGGIVSCHSGWRRTYDELGNYTYNSATGTLMMGVLPIQFHPPYLTMDWNFGPGIGTWTLTAVAP